MKQRVYHNFIQYLAIKLHKFTAFREFQSISHSSSLVEILIIFFSFTSKEKSTIDIQHGHVNPGFILDKIKSTIFIVIMQNNSTTMIWIFLSFFCFFMSCLKTQTSSLLQCLHTSTVGFSNIFVSHIFSRLNAQKGCKKGP